MQHNKKIELSIFILGIFLISTSFILWLLTPPWIHCEIYDTAPGFLLTENQSFFGNFLPKVFNLNIVEHGYYRPRIFTFILQYIDINASYRLYKYFPSIGLKFPGYAIAFFSLILSCVYFWHTIFSKRNIGFALIFAAGFLNFEIYLNTSAMVLRSGKLLTPAIGIFLIGFFIRNYKKEFIAHDFLTYIKNFALAFLFFILSTVDEQIFALIFFLLLCSLTCNIINKKYCQITNILIATVILYLVYYFFIGVYIFQYYTPGIINRNHPHKFQDVGNMNIKIFNLSIQILISNLLSLSYALPILFLSFIHAGYLLIKRNKFIYLFRSESTYILIVFLIFPVLLISSMLASHPAIYQNEILWKIFYFPFPVFALFLGLCYQVSLTSRENKVSEYLLICGFAIISLSGIINIDQNYQPYCNKFSTQFNQSSFDWCDTKFRLAPK